jgi:hypothetical protein
MSPEKIKTILQEHCLVQENSVLEIKQLQNSANETFIVTITNENSANKIFLKVYAPSEGRAVKSCELWIRDILPLSVPAPQILALGCDGEKNYLVSTFIDGITLLEKVGQSSIMPPDLILLSRQLISFIRDCAAIHMEGFGSIDKESRKGQYSTLTKFIQNNIKNASELFDRADMEDKEIRGYVEHYLRILNQYVEDNSDYLEASSSRLIPLDLNLNNFIVTIENQVFMTDLESFAAADPLLAFGELYGHVYHSSFGEFFVEEYEKFNEEEQSRIHFYALLSNFNVFCFCAAYKVSNLKELTPWGNPHSFLSLMAAHEEKIENYKNNFRMRFR